MPRTPTYVPNQPTAEATGQEAQLLAHYAERHPEATSIAYDGRCVRVENVVGPCGDLHDLVYEPGAVTWAAIVEPHCRRVLAGEHDKAHIPQSVAAHEPQSRKVAA